MLLITCTFIGVKPPIEEGRSGSYELRPFSLASSVMIVDELTSKRFPALAPMFPGKEYAPAEILAYLSPGHAEVMTLQFKVPPASLIADGGTSEKQTVSLLLTNAKAPVTAIPIRSADVKEFSVQRQQILFGYGIGPVNICTYFFFNTDQLYVSLTKSRLR